MGVGALVRQERPQTSLLKPDVPEEPVWEILVTDNVLSGTSQGERIAELYHGISSQISAV